GGLALEHARHVVVGLAGLDLLDELVHHTFEHISGPHGEAAVPGTDDPAAGVIERTAVRRREDEPALVVERPVVLPDEHWLGTASRSAPLLSPATHRMPLAPTGQGFSRRQGSASTTCLSA